MWFYSMVIGHVILCVSTKIKVNIGVISVLILFKFKFWQIDNLSKRFWQSFCLFAFCFLLLKGYRLCIMFLTFFPQHLCLTATDMYGVFSYPFMYVKCSLLWLSYWTDTCLQMIVLLCLSFLERKSKPTIIFYIFRV